MVQGWRGRANVHLGPAQATACEYGEAEVSDEGCSTTGSRQADIGGDRIRLRRHRRWPDLGEPRCAVAGFGEDERGDASVG